MSEGQPHPNPISSLLRAAGDDGAMNAFLNAQADDPSDSTPMLILADWLEEQGDAAAAGVLRSLAGAGVPSLAWLACGAGPAVAVPHKPDLFWASEGQGFGDRVAAEEDDGDASPSGDGAGDADGFETGRRDAFGLEGWHAYGCGDGDAAGHGQGSGYGSSDGSGWEAGWGLGDNDS